MSDFRDENYYENLDKRTKEYKNWVAIKQSQLDEQINGVGDIVDKITEVTGIKAVVKEFFGDDCGCDNRKDELNDLLPLTGRAVQCVTEDDYNYLKSFFSIPRTRIDRSNQERLVFIYNYVFDKRTVAPSGCATCSHGGFIKTINKLHKYFDAAQTIIDND